MAIQLIKLYKRGSDRISFFYSIPDRNSTRLCFLSSENFFLSLLRAVFTLIGEMERISAISFVDKLSLSKVANFTSAGVRSGARFFMF